MDRETEIRLRAPVDERSGDFFVDILKIAIGVFLGGAALIGALHLYAFAFLDYAAGHALFLACPESDAFGHDP